MTSSFKLDPSQFLIPLEQKLRGFQDSRGPVGIAARGKPIYNGGSNAAHSGGGPQYGRPKKGSVQEHEYALARRLGLPYGNK